MARPAAIPIDASAAWQRRRSLEAALERAREQHLALNAEDGTLHLLRSGFAVAGIAALAFCLLLSVLGGVSVDGPRTVPGWLALMVAMMSMPFGLLLLLLGGAKWMRNQVHAARASRGSARR